MSSFDIREIGPGIWWTIHSMAAQAQDSETRLQFKEYVDHMKSSFPCEKCRPHIVEFFDTHDLRDYTNDMINGNDVGLFRLTWIMHSKVNERLGKPFFPFEKAYDIYFSGGCKMEFCEGTVKEADVPKVNKKKSKFTLMRING
jgi:hypothetical protein